MDKFCSEEITWAFHSGELKCFFTIFENAETEVTMAEV